jgi:hypothetical protein
MATGYTKLGQFMTSKHYAIFRQFQSLAARDLLYLQAELVQLDSEHQNAAQTDRECTDERQHYDREWWHLSNSEPRGLGGEQWASALKIRMKLREYCNKNCLFSHFVFLGGIWLLYNPLFDCTDYQG